MEKSLISFAEAGEPGLLIVSVPAEFSASSQEQDCFVIPVLNRSGGLLICVPRGVFSEDVLIDCLSGDDASHVIGPSKGVSVQLHEESEEAGVVPVPGSVNVMLVEFSDDALAWMREYDVTGDGLDAITSFSTEHPFAIPIASQLVPFAQEWVGSQGSDRVNFYSAQEEQEPLPVKKAAAKHAAKSKTLPKRVTNAQVFEQMEVMIAQMKALSARTEILEQAKEDGAKAVPVPGGGGLPGVPSVSSGLPLFTGPPATAFSKYTSLVGPPPKVRAPIPAVPQQAAASTQVAVAEAEDPGGIAAALTQQSSAVLALVSHLANQSDSLGDIPGVTAHSTSVKGMQKREKMQQDLAMGSSTYYLQVMQQLHKKLFPSLPLPKTIDELGHLSVLNYLERSGGFKHHRESGLLMWLLGHTVDAAAQGDLHQVRERLALMLVALDQSVVDGGDWTVAYLLSLAEDPPISLFQDRSSTMAPFGKPFGSLVPPQWSSVVLAYIKEMEVLVNKKPESPKRTPKVADPENPSPKRRARFPKRPRADQEVAKGQ